MPTILQRIHAALNRLRLRCGLFRWKNYAELGVWFGEEFGDITWTVWWLRPHPNPIIVRHVVLDPRRFHRDRRGAIRYIRRCVRQGVRP